MSLDRYAADGSGDELFDELDDILSKINAVDDDFVGEKSEDVALELANAKKSISRAKAKRADTIGGIDE